MVEFIDAFADFIAGMTVREALFYFWPFFLIDFARYTLFDSFLIGRYWIGRAKRDEELQAARRRLYRERPLVSVIAPGKNEGQHIPDLARSLAEQTYKKTELVVVDDGSDDDTEAICRKLQSEGKIGRYIRHRMRGGKASAANTALRCSRGTFVVHLDADTELDRHAIERVLLPFYRDGGVGAVGGDIRVANQDVNLATRLQAIEYIKTITSGRTASSEIGILRMVAGAFGAFRRETLERLGGWDVGPGLDGDLTLKIRKLGLDVVHEPEAIAYTHVPESFRALAKQRYRWFRSMVRFRLRKHRDLLNPMSTFRFSDFFTAAENVFFGLVMNVKWWVYTLQLTVFLPEVLPFLLIINWGLYAGSNLVQWCMAQIIFARTLSRQTHALALYLPLMPFYVGIYLRLIRSYSQVMEVVHRASYRDPWNPWRVSRAAEREGL